MTSTDRVGWRRRLREQPLAVSLGVVTFFLVYGLLLRGIVVGQVYTMGDFPPYFGFRAIEKFSSTWHFQQLGYPYIYNVLPGYLGALTVVGGVFAQNLFYLSLIPGGFLAFLLFGSRFVRSLPALFLAAGVYAINPLTIGHFVNGGLSPLLGFAGLPIVLHYLYRVVERGQWRDVGITGAAFGATTTSPWLAFWMIGPFAVYLAYRTVLTPRRLGKLIFSGLLGVLLALPSVHHVLQRAGQFDEGQAILLRTVQWNYAKADPLLVARMAGNNGVRAMNALGYNTQPAMMVGLVIPGIALLAWRRKPLRVYYLIAGLIIAFLWATKHGFTHSLMEAFPPLWSVRNPVKLQYPLLICLSTLFGAGIETVLITPGRDSTSRVTPLRSVDWRGSIDSVVMVALILLSVIAYASPAAGALGLQDVRGDDYYVSQDTERITEEIDGRVLWAPYSYTSQLQLRHAYPDHVGIKSGGVLHGIPNTEYVADLYRDFSTDPASTYARLSQLGVRYVVVDSDPPMSAGEGPPQLVNRWGAPWMHGDPGAYEERLNESDLFTEVKRTERYAVYRVEDVPERNRIETYEGIHRLYYPREQPSVERVGDNVVVNPSFDDGFEQWWTHSGETGTQYRIVETAGGQSAAELQSSSGRTYPVAQSVQVEDRHPYRLSVNAEGKADVQLYWYEGERSEENLTSTGSYSLDDLPRPIVAKGDRLSIRISPNSSRLLVQRVELAPSKYPAETGFVGNQAEIPGATVDGYESDSDLGRAVAVNMDVDETESVGADVRIRDAETVLDGELVFDDSYRQGVAVRVPDGELPDTVPEDARVVTDDDAAGLVIDYWVVGEFDDQHVTVLYTSYDERWQASGDTEHFRAFGWANGYVGEDPGEIRWTGGQTRSAILPVWLAAWALVLVGLLGSTVLSVHRARAGDRQDQPVSTPEAPPEDDGSR